MKTIRLRKKEAPDELPELISEELEKESLKSTENCYTEESKKENSQNSDNNEKKEEKLPNKTEKNFSENDSNEENQLSVEVLDKGFFNELEEEIHNELNTWEELEGKLNEKFDPEDILKNMKNYWEKQKDVIFLENLAQEYKKKLSNKISNLKELEKSWQKSYFDLIKKEEEIKEEEETLKELLREFTKICKNKKEKNNIKKTENNKKKANNKKE